MKYFHNKIHFTSIFFLIVLIFSIYSSIRESYFARYTYGIRIDKKMLFKNSSDVMVNLDHDYGQNISKNLQLKINNGNGKTYYETIQYFGNNSINHKITLKDSEIKNIFIQSQQNIKLKSKDRILQSTDEQSPIFQFFITFFSYLFSCGRNLIILATATGSFDVWMPFLTFIELFNCLGFWTHDPYRFTRLFSNIFNCKYDLFNLVRFTLTSQSPPSNNPFLASYGFTSRFALNCSGELSGFLLMLVIVALIKLLSSVLKSERFRLISSKARAIFNGYVFWMTPRVLSLAGLSIRSMNQNSEIMQIIHYAIAILIIILTIAFLISLIIQIRRINQKIQYLDESTKQIGLAQRIDYQKQFQFDCLSYSILYYPAMNLFRIIFAHLCIGFAPDFHYVQYGGVIAAQVFYMMIQISCSGYKLNRDKALYPILDFFFGAFLLCLIGIGLIYSVGHLQLTINLQKFGFSLIITITLILIVQTGLDIIKCCRKSNDELVQKFTSTRKLHTSSTNHEGETKSEQQSKKSTQIFPLKNRDNNSELISTDKERQKFRDRQAIVSFNQNRQQDNQFIKSFAESKESDNNRQNRQFKSKEKINKRVKKIKNGKHI